MVKKMKKAILVFSILLCQLLMLLMVSSCFHDVKYIKFDDDRNITYQNHFYVKIDGQSANSLDLYDKYAEIDSYLGLAGGGVYYGDVHDNPVIIINTLNMVYIRDDYDFYSAPFYLVRFFDHLNNENNIFGTASFNDVLGQKERVYELEDAEYKCGELRFEGHFLIDFLGWYLVYKIDNSYYIRYNGYLYRIKDDFIPTLEDYLIWYESK